MSFALNCAVCLPLVLVWAAGGAVFGPPDVLWVLPELLASVLVFWLGWLGAVTATFGAGAPIRAAVDLHRLELYHRLGVRRPRAPVDEQDLARAVNALLLRGLALPGSVRAVGRADAAADDEAACWRASRA